MSVERGVTKDFDVRFASWRTATGRGSNVILIGARLVGVDPNHASRTKLNGKLIDVAAASGLLVYKLQFDKSVVAEIRTRVPHPAARTKDNGVRIAAVVKRGAADRSPVLEADISRGGVVVLVSFRGVALRGFSLVLTSFGGGSFCFSFASECWVGLIGSLVL